METIVLNLIDTSSPRCEYYNQRCVSLVGVNEVRWSTGGTVLAGDITFFYGKGNENHELETGFFVHMSAVKSVEFVSDGMS